MIARHDNRQTDRLGSWIPDPSGFGRLWRPDQSKGLSLFGGSSYAEEVQDREGEEVTGLRGERCVVGLGGLGLHTGIGNGACSSGLMNDSH